MYTNEDGPHKHRAINAGIDLDQTGLKDEQFRAEDSNPRSGALIADGGLDDKTAADHIESVTHSAEAALTADELSKLDAAVEHLRGDSLQAATDGGQVATAPDNADLTRFQQDLLRTLSREGELYGLAIKRQLEAERGEDINHGRLYPNLDTLVEDGLIDKHAVDKRTNGYRLTDDGKELVRRLAQQWLNATDALNGGEE